MKSKAERRTQKFTAPPKADLGKRVRMNHGMGGAFGLTPKKTEADMPPRRTSTDRARRASRMKKLDGRII